MTSWLSQEQEAKAEFGARVQQLRSLTGHTEQGEAASAFDALTEAILQFGTCELRMRRADRLRVVDPESGEARELVGSAMARHERGLVALSSARAISDALRQLEVGKESLAQWRERSSVLRSDWHEQIKQLDIGVSDAKHLARIMDECCDALDRNGPPELADWLAGQFEELDRVRREPDRGTRQASVPWWKVVVVSIMVGVSIADVWRLITRGAPWWDVVGAILLGVIVAIFAGLGC